MTYNDAIEILAYAFDGTEDWYDDETLAKFDEAHRIIHDADWGTEKVPGKESE
jgi:hypothetical protein